MPVRLTYDNNYFNDLYQGIPVGGYTQIIEKMLEGAEVRLNVDYLKEKEPRKESRVLADLIEDAGELRKKCIERMPSYLKKVDEKAWWNEKTRKKMQQWKKDRENTS